MTDLVFHILSWPTFAVALVVFGFAPGAVLRLIVLAFSRDDPRRQELLAELYAVPRIERPFWVVEQLEVALFEGLWARLATRLFGRARRRRETALWLGTMRSDCYGEFATAVRQLITVSDRICAGLGLPSTEKPLDRADGLLALAAAERDVRAKWGHVLLVGSPAVVVAAREWRHITNQLESFACGLRNDPTDYVQVSADSKSARSRFYAATRGDLGNVSGPFIDLISPAAFQQPIQQPPDPPAM